MQDALYMKNYTPEELIHKYVTGTASEEEKALVESWHLQDLEQSNHTPSAEQITAVHERMRKVLAPQLQANRRAIPRYMVRLAAAAIILGTILTSVFLWLNNTPAIPVAERKLYQGDIEAGREGAILTLTDGRTILLDTMSNGPIANQNGTEVLLKNGELSYQQGNGGTAAITYNTIATARGRTFKVILPDGSAAWLNAGSSLRYPIAFSGTDRKVEISGEVYLEVTKDKTKPFLVTCRAMTVEVLGTHFNINAYEDEPVISTTLLEGSVKVVAAPVSQSFPAQQETATPNMRILVPGQQAQLPGNSSGPSSQIKVQQVDVEQVVAWKNGVFNFQDASLEKVMRQLARWYDLEVVYEQGIPSLAFEGGMNRQNTLTEVLRSLEGLGVHFRLEEGRRLVVLP